MSIVDDDTRGEIAAQVRRVLSSQDDKSRLLALLDVTGKFDDKFRELSVAQGWPGLGIAEEYGGIGLGLAEQGIVTQEIGRATAGAPFLSAGYVMAQALIAGHNRELRDVWLPRIVSGTALAALAWVPGGERSPPARLSKGTLSGTLFGVPGALGADLALVWAQEGDAPVLAVAEVSDASLIAIDSFDNARLYADVVFDAAPAHIIARGDGARPLMRDLLARWALLTAHEQIGGAEALMETGRDYALERRAFGQPIGAFQSVKHRLAELYGLVEIARANCRHAATRVGHADFIEAAAAARISATDAYDTAARDVVQIHGGIGVAWDTGLHLHTRRARSLAIECGTMPFWEDLLVDRLVGAIA